jgi:hypothetical protein
MAQRTSWDSPASARKTPTRGCQGTTAVTSAVTSASAPRPVAAPCCGGLVRAAPVDKSLKRHVTATVSGPSCDERRRDFLDWNLLANGFDAISPEGQDSPGTMAASIIARWSSMLGGVSDAREEITMTARRSGTTVIS